jgi:transglutaminase-like putative cysteine protease
MLFSVNHRTKLSYSHAISESVMEVRAMPRTDERQVLRHFEIAVLPHAQASHHVDWLGNTVHQFSVLGVHEGVEMSSKCTIETRPFTRALSDLVAPLDGLNRDHRSWDFLHHQGPVENDPALPALSHKIGLERVRRVGEAIDIVARRTRDVIDYRRGATNSFSTVSDVLKAQAGVCQDFAHLAIALLRRVGVPTRYVSGYLYRDDVPELETHAWAEAFVPGVGWIAFDPTHGELVSERHVTIAVGRSYADVPPNRGVYRGDAKESIEVSVRIDPVEERVRVTPFSVGVERPRRVTLTRPRPVSARHLEDLEQQRLRPNAVGLVVQQQRQQQQ